MNASTPTSPINPFAGLFAASAQDRPFEGAPIPQRRAGGRRLSPRVVAQRAAAIEKGLREDKPHWVIANELGLSFWLVQNTIAANPALRAAAAQVRAQRRADKEQARNAARKQRQADRLAERAEPLTPREHARALTRELAGRCARALLAAGLAERGGETATLAGATKRAGPADVPPPTEAREAWTATAEHELQIAIDKHLRTAPRTMSFGVAARIVLAGLPLSEIARALGVSESEAATHCAAGPLGPKALDGWHPSAVMAVRGLDALALRAIRQGAGANGLGAVAKALKAAPMTLRRWEESPALRAVLYGDEAAPETNGAFQLRIPSAPAPCRLQPQEISP